MSLPIKLFGPKWEGTPVAEECELVPVPVGEPCFNCATEITATQSGVIMWNADPDDPGYRPWHRLCFLLPILGYSNWEERWR